MFQRLESKMRAAGAPEKTSFWGTWSDSGGRGPGWVGGGGVCGRGGIAAVCPELP